MTTNKPNASAVPVLISWYMTPLAIALVIMGVIYGHPDTSTGGLSVAIILLSALMNVTSVILMQQSPEKVIRIRNLRVSLNYGANFFLIFMLLPFWPDIWMLVLLMTIAAAIYNSFLSTIVHCAVFSLFLVGLTYMSGEMGGIKTAMLGMHVIIILLLGAFFNKLIHLYNPVIQQI